MLSQYPYKKQCMSKEVYGRPVLMEFCGRQYYGPEQVEEYLKRIFGENYMELPPPERRLRPGDRIETLILSR